MPLLHRSSSYKVLVSVQSLALGNVLIHKNLFTGALFLSFRFYSMSHPEIPQTSSSSTFAESVVYYDIQLMRHYSYTMITLHTLEHNRVACRKWPTYHTNTHTRLLLLTNLYKSSIHNINTYTSQGSGIKKLIANINAELRSTVCVWLRLSLKIELTFSNEF